MKRTTKNIIHFVIVGLMFVLIVGPVLFDKPPDMSSNQQAQQQIQQPGGESSPPSMPNGEEPPAKPDGETNNNQMPPDKPDGEEPPGMQNTENLRQMQGQQPSAKDESVDIFEIILYVVEFLVLSGFLVYLIMSRANKYSFKETFITKKKKIIFGVSVTVITIAGVILLNFPFGEPGPRPNQMQGQGMSQQSNIDYNAEKTINSNTDEENGEYSSNAENKLAVLVTDKITANLKKFNLTKSGSVTSGGDSTSFYGSNSGILAKSGALLNIENANINTDAKGANGVFSFGGSMQNNSDDTDGTHVTVKNTTINTKQDDSGGVMTTGGGIMDVINCIIESFGTSSAAIRTDRGGGNVNVDGGTYTTNGQGSPTIYSTANVIANNAQLNSNTSEGVVIEGKNKVNLTNCKLNDNNTKLNGQSTTYKNIFLYQSMSGDSDSGTSEFCAKNSEIITNKGDSFYVTNTKAIINLENDSIVNNDTSGNLLRIQKDSWGNEGSNGGDVAFNLSNQKALGNIVVDDISKLEMKLNNGSYWEGSVNGNDISLNLDNSSKIKLTGDCNIKSLNTSTEDYSNIDFNGHKLYVNGTAIN